MSTRNVPDENEGNRWAGNHEKVPQMPLKFNWRQIENLGQLLLTTTTEALQNR